MALNASGPISLAGTTVGQSIQKELNGTGTSQMSLNCSSVRTLAGVPSGAITMPTNFYGKSNTFSFTVAANQTNYCLRAGAVSGGWNQSSNLAVTISAGVIISSNSIGTPALRIQGSFPNGLLVTNNGTIVGMGGNGGSGTVGGGCNVPTAGCAGGTAIKICSPATFNNAGTIAGGGGGGGGAGCGVNYPSGYGAAGGGGGGGRSSNAANSSGGSGFSGGPYGGCSGPGGSGTYAAAGGGGSGSQSFDGCGTLQATGGTGGSGGNWGATGGSGSGGSPSSFRGGRGGGGGGKATCGAGTYITWTGTGTRFGSIS